MSKILNSSYHLTTFFFKTLIYKCLCQKKHKKSSYPILPWSYPSYPKKGKK